jgi:hypothetical protein
MNSRIAVLLVDLAVLYLAASGAYGQKGTLIFRSGFEEDAKIVGGDLSTDIVGTDLSVDSPNDWTKDLEGYSAFRSFETGGFCKGAKLTSNDHKVRITDDPTNAINPATKRTNKVLQLWNKNPDDNTCGWTTRPHSHVGVDGKFPELLQRFRIYLHPDLEKWFDCPGYLQLWEAKRQIDGVSRNPFFSIELMLYQDKVRKKLYWVANNRVCCGGPSQPAWKWQKENKDVPIPYGEWINAEIYWKKGDEEDGRFMFTIKRNGKPKQVVFDVTGATVEPADPDAYMYQWKVFTLYSGGGGPECVVGKGGVMQIFCDDLELWTGIAPDIGSAAIPK